MCGIAGIILQPHNRLPDLAERLAAMAHRGPNNEGVYVVPEAPVRLVNRQPAGQVSMHTNEGLTSIAATDECYNAALPNERETRGCTFHTPSNTEVIFLGYRITDKASLAQLRGRFTHKSQLRGELIVTRKPTQVVVVNVAGKQEHCYLGNLKVGFWELVQIKLDADLSLLGVTPPWQRRRSLQARFSGWHPWESQILSMGVG